ncbi:MAG: recombinase zinc beta ribbon domain-containing protein [bacterium]|nr:recombinase zinc beta ribbon domain-containing protein [bacterium]
MAKNRYGHLLRGLLHCKACRCAMSPSVTRRKERMHRYYVCGNAAKNRWKTCPHPSLPAGQIEGAVVERIACIKRNPGLLQETLAQLRTIKATRQPALTAERRRLDRELARLRDLGSGDVQVGRIEARLAEIADAQEVGREPDTESGVQDGGRRSTTCAEARRPIPLPGSSGGGWTGRRVGPETSPSPTTSTGWCAPGTSRIWRPWRGCAGSAGRGLEGGRAAGIDRSGANAIDRAGC